MILIVDNFDSFTFNLYQMVGVCATLGDHIEVVRNDSLDAHELARLGASHVILSPGPGHPAESRLSLAAPAALPRTPILGVCLGHQAIGLAYGGRIVRAARPTHGQPVTITHDDDGLFSGLPSPIEAALYHSLSVDPDSVPSDLVVTARSAQGDVMAIAHRKHPHYGVQFHPESFMTTMGSALLGNFLRQR